MIVYLDFDGVLHDEDVVWKRGKGIYVNTAARSLFEWEPFLIELLAPHPEVKIVLSTSWVLVKSFDYAKHRLSQPLRDRVVGATFHKHFMERESFINMPRGLQVCGDVLRRKPMNWLAIDDDGLGWPAWSVDKLLLTDGRLGLSDPATRQDIQRRLKAN
jgi:hypothetical protein